MQILHQSPAEFSPAHGAAWFLYLPRVWYPFSSVVIPGRALTDIEPRYPSLNPHTVSPLYAFQEFPVFGNELLFQMLADGKYGFPRQFHITQAVVVSPVVV